MILIIKEKIVHLAGGDVQVVLMLQNILDRLAIKLAVGLGARAAHGWPLGAVEHAKLDAGPVDGPAHDAVQSINFPHQLALGQAADGGVAGHLADGLQLMGDQQRFRPEAGGRSGRFGTGMTTTDNDHII